MTAIRTLSLHTAWLGLAILCLPLASQASIKWTFHSNSLHLCTAGCGSTYTPTKSFTSDPAGGPTVDVSAWGDTGSSTGNGRAIEAGDVGGPWSGLGVRNADYNTGGDQGEGVNPEHAMDSQDRFDSLRFDFSEDIELTKVAIGWYSADSDISILAHTGAGDDSLAGKSYANLITSGWELVKEVSNVHSNNSNGAANEADIAGAPAASSWLIAAFNPIFSSTSWTTYNDHVKIRLLEGRTPNNQVPEPSSILLLALVLPLLRRFRSDRQPGNDCLLA